MPGDNTDDELAVIATRDVSGGMWSFPHAADVVVIPPNAGVELFDMEIDQVSQRAKRPGYATKGDVVSATAIKGLYGYSPVSASDLLIMETNGIIYKWTGTGSFTSVQTGLTDPSDWTEFVVGNGRIFRLGQTDNIRSSIDGTTWIDEGNGNTNFPKAKLALWTSTQRMLAFNTTGEPTGMFYSNTGDPQVWDRTTNLFRFGKKDSSGVFGAIEFTNTQVIVLTNDTMELIDISNATPSNWTKAKIADIGCVAPRSVRLLGEDALFLSIDGVRSIFQSAQDKKRGASLPISFPIQDYIDRINWQYAHLIIAYVWDDKYILTVPLDLATRNTHAFVWSRRAASANEGRGGWTIWRNWNMNAYAVQDFGTKPKLYGGESSASAKVYQLRSSTPSEDVYSDAGTAIEYSETGKRLNFEAPMLDKSFETVEVEALAQTSGTLTVYAQVDGNGFQTLGTITQANGLPQLPIALPFSLGGSNKVRKMFDLSQLGRGRDIQIRITENTVDAQVQLLGYVITAYVENMEWLTE